MPADRIIRRKFFVLEISKTRIYLILAQVQNFMLIKNFILQQIVIMGYQQEVFLGIT